MLLDECFGEMARCLPFKICFVLGNHDYYGSSIAKVKGWAKEITHASDNLFWMPEMGMLELNPSTVLIGHDGWADGRLGDYANSMVILNDYFHISELKGLDKKHRLEVIHQLGDEAAHFVAHWLNKVLKTYQQVIFLTHVPPFHHVCRHSHNIAKDDHLPFLTCKAVGDVLLSVMKHHAQHKILVLSGHTHRNSVRHILPNLTIVTGGADYGTPKVQKIWSGEMDGFSFSEEIPMLPLTSAKLEFIKKRA
ncbi:MAG: phosphoesterase [Magnetococcales bacterium]|nr:phosphoesterase [Magnetococcales bacterium]NGZ28080.1 phosphoesterase [Magnetococcales bacterium]